MFQNVSEVTFLKKLKILLENMIREEQKRPEIIYQIEQLIEDWKGQLPKLQGILSPEKIDILLSEVVMKNTQQRQRIMDFVLGSGYKDEPKVDTNGNLEFRRTTPVHLASRYMFVNRKSVVHELFQIYSTFDANYVDEEGLTHFHVACKLNLIDIVEKFFNLGFDPNFNGTELVDPPLHLALFRGYKTMSELLLKRGANPNQFSAHGVTPLHIICAKNNDDVEMVNMLFEVCLDKYQPVKIDAQDKFDRTPLHYALYFNNKNLAALLLINGAHPNLAESNGYTPLHVICQKSNDDEELARLLFEIAADKNETVQIDARDKWGNPPLNLAVRCGNKKVAKFLVENRVKLACLNRNGLTPLHNICKSLLDDDELVNLFFENIEANHPSKLVNFKDNWDRTPLQLAVAKISPHAVDALLDRGADLCNFVFPNNLFDEKFGLAKDYTLASELRLASGLMAVVECLKKQGYELDQTDALTIMKLFDKYALFATSSDLEKSWSDDEEFASKAKGMTMKPNLSLLDLLQLRPKEAAKLLTSMDYFEFWRSGKIGQLPENHRTSCGFNLCEKVSRGFFHRWARNPLWELTGYRLPNLCCDMINDMLTNKDLFHIFIAAVY
uniref:Uncharacterized protein n=2 Tax=Trichogramma kaykai TaxID=54128 RepID=A0ABD2W0U0_9HYME